MVVFAFLRLASGNESWGGRGIEPSPLLLVLSHVESYFAIFLARSYTLI